MVGITKLQINKRVFFRKEKPIIKILSEINRETNIDIIYLIAELDEGLKLQLFEEIKRLTFKEIC